MVLCGVYAKLLLKGCDGMKTNKTKAEPKRRKNSLRFRMQMTLAVIIVTVLSAIFSVAIYYLFLFLNLVTLGESSPLWTTIVVFLAACIVGAMVAGFIFSYYTRPIDDVIDVMNKISKGDFSEKLTISKHERKIVKEMKNVVNTTVDELNSTEMMRNDFINTISHEFKTPVASIKGYAELLRGTELTQEQIEAVEVILQESGRLSKMTTNILLLTKYENTKFIPNKKPYSLDEQVRDAVVANQRAWLSKNINVEGDFEKVTYNGNEDVMSHVWANLLTNAIKYTSDGGNIMFTVKSDGENAVVTVEDDGVGMTKEVQAHIFDKFYQGDKSRKTEGYGIGLSIVKTIVDLCGGTIDVESAPNEGSKFTVTLPLN